MDHLCRGAGAVQSWNANGTGSGPRLSYRLVFLKDAHRTGEGAERGGQAPGSTSLGGLRPHRRVTGIPNCFYNASEAQIVTYSRTRFQTPGSRLPPFRSAELWSPVSDRHAAPTRAGRTAEGGGLQGSRDWRGRKACSRRWDRTLHMRAGRSLCLTHTSRFQHGAEGDTQLSAPPFEELGEAKAPLLPLIGHRGGRA